MVSILKGPNMMRIKLDECAYMPERGHPMDAGLDLKAPYSFTIYPGQRMDIDTGVHVEIPDGCVGLVTSKSGLMRDKGIISEGTIDSSYRGSIHAILINTSKQIVDFEVGDKITQLVILNCFIPDIEIVDKLSNTDRGDCGFGSTGK